MERILRLTSLVVANPRFRLTALLLASLAVRGIWLDKPAGALIFDEAYYVNAARVILDLPVPANQPFAGEPAGIDPNNRHPPLAKLLIAGSMRIFGDNGVGWRLPSVLLGTLSICLVYLIVRRLDPREPLAFLAAFLFAFDNLVFVHSRIATLDIFFVTFMLLGIYCYLSNKTELAAIALVAATLCKLAGVCGIVTLVAYEVFRVIRGRLTTVVGPSPQCALFSSSWAFMPCSCPQSLGCSTTSGAVTTTRSRTFGRS